MAVNILILPLLIFVNFAKSANILAVFPVTLTGDSIGYHLMNELVARKHEVTVLNLFSVQEYYGHQYVRNYTDFALDTTWKIFIDMLDDNYRRTYHTGPISGTKYVHQKSYELTEALLSDHSFQHLIQDKRDKFDLVIMEYYLNDAALGIGKILGAPVVLFSSSPSSFHVNHMFANPTAPAYIPNILTGYTGAMSFSQRFNNLIYNAFSNFYWRYFMFPKHDKLLKQHINPHYHLADIIKNIDLVFLNSHPVVNEPVHHTPNMIEIGGFHIKDKPLPPMIQLYMDEAVDGVIVFSLRYRFGSSDADYEMLRKLAEALKLVDQKVFWRFDSGMAIDVPNSFNDFKRLMYDEVPVEPKVMINSLLEGDGTYSYDEVQQGILNHPNTRLLVSQGDLNDIIEAAYFGVPVLGIPVHQDQKTYINEAVEKGFAVSIPFEGVEDIDVDWALTKILESSQYEEKAEELSQLMREDVVKPMDLAMHWIEFAIRHNGTQHLKSPGVQLEWYKRSMLDVILVLAIIDIILFIIFYYIIKHVIHHIVKALKKCRSRKTKKYDKLNEEANN